jgi:Zn-dependent protease with chaperone function
MTGQPTAVLEAALAAIKYENYAQAIPLLEGYIEQHASPDDAAPQLLKARMGLVVAYDRTHQIASAIAVCQPLTASPNPKVKAWADRTLADLQQRPSAPRAAPKTGFVPLDTGFVPLDPEVASNAAPAERSVFIPNQVPEVRENQTAADQVAAVKLTRNRTSETPIATASSHRDQPRDSRSLPQTPLSVIKRAQKWSEIAPFPPLPLMIAQVGTVFCLLLSLSLLAIFSMALPLLWFQIKINLLRWSSYPIDTSIPLLQLGVVLAGLWLASPWILDFLLTHLDGMKPLSTSSLARYSPETHRLLQRFCQQRRIPLLKLGVLPTPAPLIFTYGPLPNLARIVVSQGLLEQLADDEIAALYAAEMGHIHHGDFSVMSLVAVVTQLPYALYRLAALGGDRLRLSSRRYREQAYMAFSCGITADLLVCVAALSYGVYWWLSRAGLWLSQQRVAYGDWFACHLTGNPHGLTRALLKLATGIAATGQQQQQTDYALESFALLSPLNPRTALVTGSLAVHLPWADLLTWDQVNPHRRWLALNQAHALLGERLRRLDRYAQTWQLDSAIACLPRSAATGWQLPLPQAFPWIGGMAGLLLASLFWGIGWGVYIAGSDQLRWMASDYKLFFGLPLIGFGIGSLLRFNPYFPDLESLHRQQRRPNAAADLGGDSAADPLPQILTAARPTPNQPIVLEGILLGRPGMANSLGQDLALQTATGVINLHYCSQVGILGNLVQYRQWVNLLGKPVVAIGWCRRSAAPSVEVDTIRGADGRSLRSGHQIWAVLLASMATLAGVILAL